MTTSASVSVHSHLKLQERGVFFDSVMDSDSGELSDLLTSSSDDEVTPERDPAPPQLDADELIRRQTHFSDICREVYSNIPAPPPDGSLEHLMYLYYYAVQFVIVYNKHDARPVPDFVSDTDEIIREKAYINHLFLSYRSFQKQMELLSNNVYRLVRKRLLELAPSENRDTLVWFIEQLGIFTELHSRRIKSDPAASRTKTDVIQRTFNVITGEEYNHHNDDHKSWRQLILNPLPSDLDRNAIDPKEGGKTHELALAVEKLRGKAVVPDPFLVVVTTEWDKLLRILHTLLHFEDYMHTYLVGCINLDEIAKMTWAQSWSHLFKEHKDTPIKTLSREKKKTPQIVSRTAELRDFIVCSRAFDQP